MRAMTFIAIGIVGTIAYQKICENKSAIMKEMRKMMKNSNRSMQKIREIF